MLHVNSGILLDSTVNIKKKVNSGILLDSTVNIKKKS